MCSPLLKRPESEANHFPLSGFEFKNDSFYPSPPPVRLHGQQKGNITISSIICTTLKYSLMGLTPCILVARIKNVLEMKVVLFFAGGFSKSVRNRAVARPMNTVFAAPRAGVYMYKSLCM